MIFRLRVEVKIERGESASAADRTIDALAGPPCVGAGYEFDTGMRDREYDFTTHVDATAALMRVKVGLRKRKRTCRLDIHRAELARARAPEADA